MWNEYVSIKTTDKPDDLSRVDNGVSNIHKMVFLDVVTSPLCIIYPTPFDIHHLPVFALSFLTLGSFCTNIYSPQTKFAKVMFSQGSVCPGGVYSSVHWAGGFVSRQALGKRGVYPSMHWAGGVCPGGMCGRHPNQR